MLLIINLKKSHLEYPNLPGMTAYIGSTCINTDKA